LFAKAGTALHFNEEYTQTLKEKQDYQRGYELLCLIAFSLPS
jgi:hypothetical protein